MCTLASRFCLLVGFVWHFDIRTSFAGVKSNLALLNLHCFFPRSLLSWQPRCCFNYYAVLGRPATRGEKRIYSPSWCLLPWCFACNVNTLTFTATAQWLRHPRGRGGHLRAGQLPHQRRPERDGMAPMVTWCCQVVPKTLLRHVFLLQMLLVDFYRGAPDLVQFTQYWCPDTTMLDKIKVRRLTSDCMRKILVNAFIAANQVAASQNLWMYNMHNRTNQV